MHNIMYCIIEYKVKCNDRASCYDVAAQRAAVCCKADRKRNIRSPSSSQPKSVFLLSKCDRAFPPLKGNSLKDEMSGNRVLYKITVSIRVVPRRYVIFVSCAVCMRDEDFFVFVFNKIIFQNWRWIYENIIFNIGMS